MSKSTELKTPDYSSYLDDVIDELMRIKNSLKKGNLRKENRKEVSHLQNAISALRHLRNKNDRSMNKMIPDSQKNIKEVFGHDDIRSFLMGRINYED